MNNRNILEKLEQINDGNREICIFGAGVVGKNYGLVLLKKRGIVPNFYCDSNPDLWGKEITDGIKCISLNELKKRNPVCFIMVSIHLRDEVYEFVKGLGITDIVLYDDLCKLEFESYFEFMNRKQIAVYTCILNDYDEVKEPLVKSEECDYYLISDKKPDKDSVYKYIDIKEINIDNVDDYTRKNRYCKIKAHEIFPEYRYSIYLDGNLRIKNNQIFEKIYKLPKTRIITHAINYDDNIYLEAMRAAEHFRDNKEKISKQVEKYWLEGMPDNYGLFACGILIREHNNPICKRLMNQWWEEVKNYSKKDQISFSYVLWKNGYEKSDVNVLMNRIEDAYGRRNKYVEVERNHRKKYYNGSKNDENI